MRIGIIMLLILTSICCANKKITEESTPVPMLTSQGGTFQRIVPGMEDGEQTVKLAINISSSVEGVSVDSVYFMERKAAMREAGSPEVVTFKAKLNLSTGAVQKSPIELGSNEAVVVWRYEGKRRLLKVSEIEEKEALYAP